MYNLPYCTMRDHQISMVLKCHFGRNRNKSLAVIVLPGHIYGPSTQLPWLAARRKATCQTQPTPAHGDSHAIMNARLGGDGCGVAGDDAITGLCCRLLPARVRKLKKSIPVCIIFIKRVILGLEKKYLPVIVCAEVLTVAL